MHTNVFLTEDEKIVLVTHKQQFVTIKIIPIQTFKTFLNDKSIQYMKNTGDYSMLYQLLNNPIAKMLIDDYDLFFAQKKLIKDVLLRLEVNYGPLMFTKLMKDISTNDTYTLTNINDTAEIFTFEKTEDELYKVYIPEYMIFNDPIVQHKNKSKFNNRILIGIFSFYRLAEFLKAIFNFRQNIPLSELEALELELNNIDDNNIEKSTEEQKEEQFDKVEKEPHNNISKLSSLKPPYEGAVISYAAPSTNCEVDLSKLEQKIDEVKECIANSNTSTNIQINAKQILDTILGIAELDDETYEKLEQSPIINTVVQMINEQVRHTIEISSRSLFYDIEKEVKRFTERTQGFKDEIDALSIAFRAHTSKIDAVEIAAGGMMRELQNLTKIVQELKEKIDKISEGNNSNNDIESQQNTISSFNNHTINDQITNSQTLNNMSIQTNNTNNISNQISDSITTIPNNQTQIDNNNITNNSTILSINNVNQNSTNIAVDNENISSTAVIELPKQDIIKEEEKIETVNVLHNPIADILEEEIDNKETEIENLNTEVLPDIKEENTDETESLNLAELAAQELSTQLDVKYKENIINIEENTPNTNEDKIKTVTKKSTELKPLKIEIKDNDLMHKYFTLKSLLKDIRFDTSPNEQINTVQIKEKNKQLPQQQYIQNAAALLNAFPIYVDTQNVYSYIESLDKNNKEAIEHNINTITEFLIALTLKHYFLNNAKSKTANNILYMLYRYIIETRLGEDLYKVLSYAYKKSGEALTGHGTLPHLAYQLQLIPVTLIKMFKHDVSIQYIFKFVKDYVTQFGYEKYYNEVFYGRLKDIVNDFNNKYNFKYFDRQTNNTNDEFVDTFVRAKIISFEDSAELNEFATPEEYAFKVNPDKLFENIKIAANSKFNTNTINDLHNYVMESYHNARQAIFFTLQNDYCKTFNDLIERAPIHPNVFRILSNDNSQLAKLESYSTFKHIIELIRKSASQPIPETIDHEEELFVDDKINFIISESIKSIMEFIGYDIHEKCALKNTNDLAYQQIEEIKNLFNTDNLKEILEDFINNSKILQEDKLHFDKNKFEMLRHTPKSIEHLFIIVSAFYKYTTDQSRRDLILRELREYLETKYNIDDITKYMKLHPLALSKLIEEIRDDLVELDAITRTLNDAGSSAQKLYEMYLNIMSKLSMTYLFDKITRKIVNELIADILKDKTCGVYKYIKPLN